MAGYITEGACLVNTTHCQRVPVSRPLKQDRRPSRNVPSPEEDDPSVSVFLQTSQVRALLAALHPGGAIVIATTLSRISLLG